MSFYSNVRVFNSGFFHHSRCFLDTFDKKNDINPATQRAGIRCHSLFTALILKIFGKIKEIKTSDGKIIYLNKGSFNAWRKRHAVEIKSQALPSASTIIVYHQKLLTQNERPVQKKGPLQGHVITLLPNHTPVENGVEADAVADNQATNKDLEESPTSDNNTSPKQSDDYKTVSLAKRWGMKIVPALVPELKVPLAVMKSGVTVMDAVDSYQKGNTWGAIKKVAPLAVGGGLMLYGGPWVAAAMAAYKVYSLANLLIDTTDALMPVEEADVQPTVEEIAEEE